MIKSILRNIYRNSSRQKGLTLINVAGFAVGLAASLLILMWVKNLLILLSSTIPLVLVALSMGVFNVIVQFSLSVFIALGAIFIYLQLAYMQKKELGFDIENLVCIPMKAF